MKTSTITQFYETFCGIVSNLISGIATFRKLDKSYAAVDLGSIIDDNTDFGISATDHPKLLGFFDDLKAVTTDYVLAAMYAYFQAVSYYNSLSLSTAIADDLQFTDGNTGLNLKNAIEALTTLNVFLSAGHYTNLCRMEYTSAKVNLGFPSPAWESGITGGQIKSVITSLEAIDNHLTSTLNYSKLYQLI